MSVLVEARSPGTLRRIDTPPDLPLGAPAPETIPDIERDPMAPPTTIEEPDAPPPIWPDDDTESTPYDEPGTDGNEASP